MKINLIKKEFLEHFPFTLTASLFAAMLIYSIYLFYPNSSSSFEFLFEIMHPAHIFVSAIVSSGMYYKYQNNFFKALLIGVLTSIIIGSISDIIFPWLGGKIFNLETSFHLLAIEEPLLIFGIAILASLIGIFTKITKIPHFLHVFISVFASLFYLLAFSFSIDFIAIILISIIVFVSVIIPCCFGDIILPLIFIKKEKSSH